MTVMVTGASGPIGHALIPLLVRNDEVRAAVRRTDAAAPLRSLGAKVTIGRTDDVDALAEVLRGVYSLIHLVGGPNHLDADTVMDANHGSSVGPSVPRSSRASIGSCSSLFRGQARTPAMCSCAPRGWRRKRSSTAGWSTP